MPVKLSRGTKTHMNHRRSIKEPFNILEVEGIFRDHLAIPFDLTVKRACGPEILNFLLWVTQLSHRLSGS